MLPEAMQHRVTPADVQPSNLDTITPYLESLYAMPTGTVEGLNAFLEAWNEIDAWIVQYIKDAQLLTVTNTEDEAAQAQWMRLLGEVLPQLTEWHEKLGRKLLDSEGVDKLNDSPFKPYVDQVRSGVELFRAENVSLQKDVSEFVNNYTKISGAWQVEFRGQTYPRPAMSKFLMSPDRETRKEAWLATNATTNKDAEQLDDLFEQMMELRDRMAHNSGFDNFRDYIFAQKMRDYSPDECFAYHEIVAKEVVPLAKEISENTRKKLGLDTMKPWDASADPDGGEPLNPFNTAQELQDGVERMLRRLDSELGQQFHEIREFQDLDSRPAKAPGGFMATLPWKRRPFIFANASGVHRDIVTLLHEAGHAFHAIASVDNMPMWTTSVPMEFNEVASMAMELLTYDSLDEFYDEADKKRAIQQHLSRIPGLLTMVARGDAFQHWIYTNEGHTRTERHDKWVELDSVFSTGVDWDGVDLGYRRNSWHPILHFFQVPFYFIEYGFAQLGSLQVAVNAQKDPAGALAAYKNALSLGPQRDTFGLYKAAGAEFIPTADKVRELMNWIREGLELS